MRIFQKECSQSDSLLNKMFSFLFAFINEKPSVNQIRLNEIILVTSLPKVVVELIFSYESERLNPSEIPKSLNFKPNRNMELEILQNEKNFLLSSERYSYTSTINIYNYDRMLKLKDLDERIEELAIANDSNDKFNF